MTLENFGPLELGTIAVGVLVIAGIIYWRIRLSKKGINEDKF